MPRIALALVEKNVCLNSYEFHVSHRSQVAITRSPIYRPHGCRFVRLDYLGFPHK